MPSFKIYLIFDAVKLLYADLPSYFGIKMKRKMRRKRHKHFHSKYTTTHRKFTIFS
jgi:hypothetical protein